MEAAPERIHQLHLDGLDPNTSYRYRVEPIGQGDGSGSFRTAPSTNDAFAFVVLGDTRFHHDIHQAIVRQIQLEPDHRFVFNLGDLVDDGESASEWKAFFEDVSPLARFTPYASTLGNHERNADLYFELFSLPRNGSDPERNYSFDYGNTHFTVIDSNPEYRHDERQLEWLDQDLQRAQAATFRIVFFHHSGHGTRPDRKEDHEDVSRLLDGYFERGRVTVVFNGHDHNYVHARKNGIDYVVTGGGGGPLEPLGPRNAETIVQYKIHHYCRVAVSPEQLEVVAIDTAGRHIDSFVRPGDLRPAGRAARSRGRGCGSPCVARRRGMTSRVLYTLLSAALVVVLFVSIDSFMGRTLGTVIWIHGIDTKVAKYGLQILVAGLALALTRRGAYRALFLSLCFLLDLLWYGFAIYFRAPLEPHHIMYGVHELGEVWLEFSAKLPHFLPAFGFIAMAYCATGFALERIRPRTPHVPFAPAVLVALLLAEPALIYASNVDVRYYPITRPSPALQRHPHALDRRDHRDRTETRRRSGHRLRGDARRPDRDRGGAAHRGRRHGRKHLSFPVAHPG